MLILLLLLKYYSLSIFTMIYSVVHNLENTYLKHVKTATVFSGTAGLLSGLHANSHNVFETETNDMSKRANKFYTNLIGYTSLGLITGIAYPISFPLSVYFLYTTK